MRIGRLAYRAAVIFAWLSVVFLIQMAAPLPVYWWKAKHNPYIAAFQQRNPLPSFPGTPKAQPVHELSTADQVSWFSTPLSSGEEGTLPIANWERPAWLTESQERIVLRCDAFPMLNERDRSFFAVLHNDVVVAFDDARRPVQIYGAGAYQDFVHLLLSTFEGKVLLLTRFRSMRDAFYSGLNSTIETQTPQPAIVPAHLGRDLRGDLPVFFLPAPSTRPASSLREVVYAFIPVRNLLVQSLQQIGASSAAASKERSPWKIPFMRYKSNIVGYHSGLGTTLDTNSYGFRNEETAIPKPAGLFRILCIGGSTTEEGGTNQITYPKFVERNLRKRFPGHSIEVINCGVSGLESATQMCRLADYLSLNPDLLVIYDGVNDLSFDFARTSAPAMQTCLQKALKHSLLHLPLNRLEYPSDAALVRWLDRHTFAHFDAILRVAARRNIRVAFCSFAYPDSDEMTPDEFEFFDYWTRTQWSDGRFTLPTYAALMNVFNRALKDRCAREGLLYIPVAELLKGGTDYFMDVCHMVPAGIERKAEIITAYLEDFIRPALEGARTSS